MSAAAEGGEKKKMSLGAKAKSFFGGVKDALKDAATIDLTFDNEEARLKVRTPLHPTAQNCNTLVEGIGANRRGRQGPVHIFSRGECIHCALLLLPRRRIHCVLTGGCNWKGGYRAEVLRAIPSCKHLCLLF